MNKAGLEKAEDLLYSVVRFYEEEQRLYASDDYDLEFFKGAQSALRIAINRIRHELTKV